MRANVRRKLIQILDVEPLTEETWKSLLDDLKPKAISSLIEPGERVAIRQD